MISEINLGNFYVIYFFSEFNLGFNLVLRSKQVHWGFLKELYHLLQIGTFLVNHNLKIFLLRAVQLNIIVVWFHISLKSN